MAKTNLRSVDDYIASQPEATQAVLKRVRGIIRKALGSDLVSLDQWPKLRAYRVTC